MSCILIDAHLSDGDQLVMHDVFALRDIEVSTRVHIFPPTPHFPSHALLLHTANRGPLLRPHQKAVNQTIKWSDDMSATHTTSHAKFHPLRSAGKCTIPSRYNFAKIYRRVFLFIGYKNGYQRYCICPAKEQINCSCMLFDVIHTDGFK